MWLAICDAEDLGGLWAVTRLRRLGLQPFEIILPEELLIGARITHSVGEGERGSRLQARLRDGREFSSETVAGVLNRLLEIPAECLREFSDRDREYVVEEQRAFFASWLYSLPCPVLNRPSPAGLCGEWRDASEWRLLGHAAGLDTLPACCSSRYGLETETVPTNPVKVLMVGSEVVSPVPARVAAGCAALARASGATVLGLTFDRTTDDAWRFVTATPLPDLSIGGSAGIEALAQALRG